MCFFVFLRIFELEKGEEVIFSIRQPDDPSSCALGGDDIGGGSVGQQRTACSLRKELLLVAPRSIILIGDCCFQRLHTAQVIHQLPTRMCTVVRCWLFFLRLYSRIHSIKIPTAPTYVVYVL